MTTGVFSMDGWSKLSKKGLRLPNSLSPVSEKCFRSHDIDMSDEYGLARPAAIEATITCDNAPAIRARLVVEAANIPVTHLAAAKERWLPNSKVVCA